MINTNEYFARHGVLIPLNTVQQAHVNNAADLLKRVNQLLAVFDAERGSHWLANVSSGYRTPAINASIKGAARKSWHLQGKAIDISDRQRTLQRWLNTANGTQQLVLCGLYAEDFSATTTWVHLQTESPASGRRFFLP